MTQRLHPEDLRALIAAIYDASPNAIHQPKSAVDKAEHLLRLLAKTAPPEAEDMPLDIAAIRSGTVGLPTKASGVVHREYAEAWQARAEAAEELLKACSFAFGTEDRASIPNRIRDLKVALLQAEDDLSATENKLTTATAQLETAEDRANKFQASYDHLNKAWNYNVHKWGEIIGSRYAYDQPEVILDIDRALEQGVKDAARVKELEAELQRLRHIAEGPWTRAQLAAEVDRLTDALHTARAEGAKQERERLSHYIAHAPGCSVFPYVPWNTSQCTCGLREALEVKP